MEGEGARTKTALRKKPTSAPELMSKQRLPELGDSPKIIPEMDSDLSEPSTTDLEEEKKEYLTELQNQADEVWTNLLLVGNMHFLKGAPELIKNLLKIHDVYLKTIKVNDSSKSSE